MLEGDLSALLCRNFLDSLRGRRAGNGCVGLDKRGAHEYLCGAVNGGDCQFLPHCWRPLFLVCPCFELALSSYQPQVAKNAVLLVLFCFNV